MGFMDERPYAGPGLGPTGLGDQPIDYSQFATMAPDSSSMTNWGGGGQQPFTFGQTLDNGFKMPQAQAPVPGGGGGMNWLTKTDPKTGMKSQGMLNFGMGALQAGAGFYLGSKQLGLAEDQFAESKRQFGKNFGSQVKQYNTNIEDRQDRRYSGAGGGTVAKNPYAQTDEYMKKNRMVG